MYFLTIIGLVILLLALITGFIRYRHDHTPKRHLLFPILYGVFGLFVIMWSFLP